MKRIVLFCLFFLIVFTSCYSQTTVYIDLELKNKELKPTYQNPKLGQYTIYAYLNGNEKATVVPYDDPLYPNTFGSITFGSGIDVIRLEIESPGFKKYLDELHLDQIDGDVFSLGKISLIKSDFPVIVDVLDSENEELNVYEVLFDNPSKKRFIIDKIYIELDFYYDSNVNGINYSNIPEKTFIVKPEIFQKTGQFIEVKYLDTDNKFNSTYTATGKLDAFPTRKALRLTYSFNTLIEIEGTSSYKTTIALPKEFLVENQFEFEIYIKSNSSTLPKNNQLKNPYKVGFSFYSSSAKNIVSHEKKF
ncbi:MAG: hypothetical protein AAGC43_08880 [Bacteroidota bacterium]